MLLCNDMIKIILLKRLENLFCERWYFELNY